MPHTTAIILVISNGILFYSLLVLLWQKQPLITRIHRYIQEKEEKRVHRKKIKIGNIRQASKTIGEKVSSIIFLKGYQSYLKKELEKANLPLKVEEVITISLFLSMLGGAYYCVSQNLGMSIVIAVLFWLLPLVVISSKKKKRLRDLNYQLGDLLILISNSLKAGYSFLQSVETAAKEMPPPISDEFIKTLREMNLGVPTEKALANLAERVQSQDMEMVVTAILIQRQVGGNLAEVLDNISFTIRERVKLKGEIKTITAQGRISGIVISLLPVFIVVVFLFINPEYMTKLFTHPLGIFLLCTGILMQIIGMILIRKIVDIEM